MGHLVSAHPPGGDGEAGGGRSRSGPAAAQLRSTRGRASVRPGNAEKWSGWKHISEVEVTVSAHELTVYSMRKQHGPRKAPGF